MAVVDWQVIPEMDVIINHSAKSHSSHSTAGASEMAIVLSPYRTVSRLKEASANISVSPRDDGTTRGSQNPLAAGPSLLKLSGTSVLIWHLL